MDIQKAIDEMSRYGHLNAEQAESVMRQIMTGGATEAQIGAYLMALRMKGETTDEITGSARVDAPGGHQGADYRHRRHARYLRHRRRPLGYIQHQYHRRFRGRWRRHPGGETWQTAPPAARAAALMC